MSKMNFYKLNDNKKIKEIKKFLNKKIKNTTLVVFFL